MAKRKPIQWTDEMKDYLRAEYKERPLKSIVPDFNKKFGLDVNHSTLKGATARYNIRSGRTGHLDGARSYRHPKGARLSPATEFKKGQRPLNWKPVGSTRVCTKDGYIRVKEFEGQKVWGLLHRAVWRKAHGEIPNNYIIIFLDGNRQNCDLSNLRMVSRGESAILNKHNIPYGDDESLNTALIMVKLIQAKTKRAKEMKRKRGGRGGE